MLVGCWSFTSWQHLKLYQDRYRLVLVHTHGVFIVLAHWEIRLLAQWPDISLLSWHWVPKSLSYPNNAKRLVRQWQVSLLTLFRLVVERLSIEHAAQWVATYRLNSSLSSECDVVMVIVYSDVLTMRYIDLLTNLHQGLFTSNRYSWLMLPATLHYKQPTLRCYCIPDYCSPLQTAYPEVLLYSWLMFSVTNSLPWGITVFLTNVLRYKQPTLRCYCIPD